MISTVWVAEVVTIIMSHSKFTFNLLQFFFFEGSNYFASSPNTAFVSFLCLQIRIRDLVNILLNGIGFFKLFCRVYVAPTRRQTWAGASGTRAITHPGRTWFAQSIVDWSTIEFLEKHKKIIKTKNSKKLK